MPSSIVVEHNNVRMTFNEENHSYVDSNNKPYTSVTTLVGMGFEKFDAVNVAKRKAEKEGGDWHELVEQWSETGRKAAYFGTRLHERCEHQILGHYDSLSKPLNSMEELNFKQAYDEVERIKNERGVIKLEPEKLVFSPRLGLAGSIDLLASYENGSYRIYDWKNIKDLSTTGFRGKTGIIPPTKEIQDSNYWHYALQLQLYEIILKIEGYIPKDASVSRFLNCFISCSMRQVEMPDVMENAKELIKWLNRK